MNKTMLLVLVVLSFAGFCGCSGSGSSSTAATYEVALSPIRTAWPIVRETSGQWEIVGEAMFRNLGTETVVISGVTLTIFNASNAVLTERTYGPDKFNDMIMIAIRSPNGQYTQISPSRTTLQPTDIGFCHMAALAAGSSLPSHARLSVSFTNGRTETSDVTLYEYALTQQMIWPATFGGLNWIAMNTGEAYHHWNEINTHPLTGEMVNSERYAIDILQIDGQYNLSNPSDSLNKEDYYSWNQDVLSVGSGTVVNVLTSRIDQAIGTYDLNWTIGNFVVIQHGPKLYSLYGHMMNSSATVTIGAAVTAGQVIGKIGNSGYSTAPHIHFQFMDDPDFYKGQGLPALFSNLTINRLSDADLLTILGELPDVRTQNYLLSAGTYTVSGRTPLEYDIIPAP